MIEPNILAIKRELLLASESQDWNRRCEAISRWWDKYVCECGVEHTIDRQILEKPPKDFIEMVHHTMHMRIADEIKKMDIGILDTDINWRENLRVPDRWWKPRVDRLRAFFIREPNPYKGERPSTIQTTREKNENHQPS